MTTNGHVAEVLPPNNTTAEDHVIGAILKSQGECLDRIGMLLQPESFYQRKAADIYRAAVGLHERRVPVDYATLARELQGWDTGIRMKDLAGYDLGVPTAAHAEHYALIVNEMATRRRIIHAAQTASELAYDVTRDMRQVMSRSAAASQWAMLSALAGNQSGAMDDAIAQFAERLRSSGASELAGLSTPWKGINKMTFGLVPQNVYLQPARTQVGKSVLGEQLALHFATHHGPVFLASLEMSQQKLLERATAMMVHIPRRRVMTNQLSDAERERVIAAASELGRLPISVWTGAGTIEQITAACLRYASEMGSLSLVVVDYVQLLGSEASDGKIREQVVAAASRGIKNLAERCRVPVWAPVQVNREAVKRRGDQLPELHDMRESGALEQDADYVIALYRDDPQVPIANQRMPGEAMVMLLKDRDTGNAGARCYLKWNKAGEYYTDADQRLHTSQSVLPVDPFDGEA